MINEQELFSLRKQIDSVRQPSHTPKFQALLNELVAPNTTPYGVRYPDKQAICAKCAVQSQVRWPAMTPAQPYVYRISSWQALVKGCNWRDRFEAENHEYSFSRYHDPRAATRWRSLASHAAGHLSGVGGITWWTPEPALESGIVVPTAYRIGLPEDYLSTDCVILRCDLSSCPSNGFVPSILDAFFSEVFLATRESDSPGVGRAIHLKAHEPLELGAVELVWGAIPVSALSFSTVALGPSPNGVRLDDSLRDRIATFLRSTL